jgi:Tol biopolymer transport system component
MNHNDGFERTVSAWLTEQAGRGAPDYLWEVLARTTRTRQRAAWSSLERWLPVQSITRFAPVPRMAWLLVILGLVLAVGATVVFIGSRTRPLPPPFGMTGQRTLLYGAADGDIYALDPATNEAHPLISGPTTDRLPSLSPDGTMVVFTRQESELVPATAMVANADGSDIRMLSDRAHGFSWMAWSPDSARLAATGTVDGVLGIWILAPDATPVKVTSQQEYPTVPAYFNEPVWRPNGHELVFRGDYLDQMTPVGLYLIQADGTGLRAILDKSVASLAEPALSPDGTRVAYSVLHGDRRELHVVNVDTGEDALVPFTGAGSDRRPQWSADGRRLVFERYKGDTYHLAVGSVDGGAVAEVGPAQPANTGGSEARFSPDGTKVIAFYKSDGSSWILDPVVGSQVRLDEGITSPLSWPRTAP